MSRKEESEAAGNLMMQRLVREGALMAYFLLALFLLIALLSYSPADPGYTTTGNDGEIVNAVGVYGAWLADALLHLLGYLAYAFPALLAWKVCSSFRESELEAPFFWSMIWLKTLGFLLLLVSACGLATLHFKVAAGTPYLAGGIVGSLVVDLTLPVVASLGSTLLLFALFLFSLTITLTISWLAVVDRLGAMVIPAYEFVVSRCMKWIEQGRQQAATRKRVESRRQRLDNHIREGKKRIAPTIESPPSQLPGPAPAVQTAAAGSAAREQKANKQKEPRSTRVETLPTVDLLDAWEQTNDSGFSPESLEAMSRLLEAKLKDFGIDIEVTAVKPGPVITRFEVQPAPGIKVSRISNLVKDLARSLAVVSVRVVEVIPGKTVIGIEIPNERRDIIQLSQVLASSEFERAGSPLSMALGHDIVGKPIIVDLAKMPHLLVAGTTGSGKSVGINAMILSLLFKSPPQQVRMIMIDPKMLELSVYDGIPHLLTPVITDMKEAANGLRWCVGEMETRYRLMSALGVRNLTGYNQKVADARKAGNPLKWQPPTTDAVVEGEAPELEVLPRIVVVVDELADMMMVVGKKVEELIARIAQKARAAGIHLILATQRPSVDVLTGLIKANIPTRLSFMLQSMVDSRTILGEGGAEQLLGHGDMLFLPPGGGVPTRVHGAFVSDEEVHRVVQDWKTRGEPVYIEDVTRGGESDAGSIDTGDDGEEDDALYDEAVRYVTESRKASISAVQRKLRIGYNRAARMIESMEAAGVVSPMNSNGSREVLATAPPRD